MEYAPAPYVGYRGCFVTHVSNVLWASCASLTVVDTIVLLLIVTSALRAYKTGGHGELSHVIHRDGVLFYVYLLCMPCGPENTSNSHLYHLCRHHNRKRNDHTCGAPWFEFDLDPSAGRHVFCVHCPDYSQHSRSGASRHASGIAYPAPLA